LGIPGAKDSQGKVAEPRIGVNAVSMTADVDLVKGAGFIAVPSLREADPGPVVAVVAPLPDGQVGITVAAGDLDGDIVQFVVEFEFVVVPVAGGPGDSGFFVKHCRAATNIAVVAARHQLAANDPGFALDFADLV